MIDSADLQSLFTIGCLQEFRPNDQVSIEVRALERWGNSGENLGRGSSTTKTGCPGGTVGKSMEKWSYACAETFGTSTPSTKTNQRTDAWQSLILRRLWLTFAIFSMGKCSPKKNSKATVFFPSPNGSGSRNGDFLGINISQHLPIKHGTAQGKR